MALLHTVINLRPELTKHGLSWRIYIHNTIKIKTFYLKKYSKSPRLPEDAWEKLEQRQADHTIMKNPTRGEP